METTYKGSVYLSGPILGETYADARYGWRKRVTENLANGIKVLSPMRHEGHLAEVQGPLAVDYPSHFFSGAKVIVEKDRLDIKRSDIVLVHLLGAQRISIGTVSEMGMACEAGKTIILVMEDAGNIHEHPFVTQVAALRLNNLDDAIYAINQLLSEGI
jgi:nucleoside 2-deoxyribosyltransferase